MTLSAKAVLCVDCFLIVDLSLEGSGFMVCVYCGLLLLATCKDLPVAVYFENCGISLHLLI